MPRKAQPAGEMSLLVNLAHFPDTIHALRFKSEEEVAGADTSSQQRQPRVSTQQHKKAMDTSKMSVPHSVVHARSYVDEVEKSPLPSSKPKAEPGVKGMVSLPQWFKQSPFFCSCRRSKINRSRKPRMFCRRFPTGRVISLFSMISIDIHQQQKS